MDTKASNLGVDNNKQILMQSLSKLDCYKPVIGGHICWKTNELIV